MIPDILRLLLLVLLVKHYTFFVTNAPTRCCTNSAFGGNACPRRQRLQADLIAYNTLVKAPVAIWAWTIGEASRSWKATVLKLSKRGLPICPQTCNPLEGSFGRKLVFQDPIVRFHVGGRKTNRFETSQGSTENVQAPGSLNDKL